MRMSIIAVVCLALIGLFISLLPTPEITPAARNSAEESSIDWPESVSYRLTNVTVFDGEQWHENTTLVVNNGRIMALGADVGAQSGNAELDMVDGQGGFVIPGLIDAHTHNWGNALTQSLQYGVTTTLDMFTDPQFMLSKRAQRDSLATVREADLFSSGVLVTSKGGHGTEYGITIPTIATPGEADAFVAARLAEGSDYIKIVYDASASEAGHKGRFTSIDYPTLEAVVNAAHTQHALAVVHVMDLTSAEHAAKAGADGLVHTFGGEPASEELIALMQSRNMFIIPTLSILASIAGEGRGQALITHSAFSGHIGADVEHAIANDIDSDRVSDDYFDIAKVNTRRMHNAGIEVLAGTDAPNQGTAHGISLHDELALLVDSGLSPTEALQAATYLPYSRFNIGERGNLKPGARADFVVLARDPRHDIRNTQHIRAIVKNGAKVPAYFEAETATGITPVSGVVSDFESDLTPKLGTRFVVSTDQMMKGDSVASIHYVENGCDGSGALKVEGRIGPAFPYPWAGAFLMFGETMSSGYNLSNFKRIVFDVKGTNGQFRLMVLNPQTARPSEVSFAVTSECQRVSVALEDIGGVDWHNVAGIGWVAGAATPDFTFELDNIEFE
ncbi:amidohydrolase family protein [Alteromonas sp. AMM-1]|uniref:amidohydrolase family protein n=1 Tax=Alteromonas sp. AMM-1 TaxID=3394233 RepID=UPI0039A494B1